MQWQLKAIVAAMSMAACAAVSAHGSSNSAQANDDTLSAGRVPPPAVTGNTTIPRDCAGMRGDARVACIRDEQSRGVVDNDRDDTMRRQGMSRGGGQDATQGGQGTSASGTAGTPSGANASGTGNAGAAATGATGGMGGNAAGNAAGTAGGAPGGTAGAAAGAGGAAAGAK